MISFPIPYAISNKAQALSLARNSDCNQTEHEVQVNKRTRQQLTTYMQMVNQIKLNVSDGLPGRQNWN